MRIKKMIFSMMLNSLTLSVAAQSISSDFMNSKKDIVDSLKEHNLSVLAKTARWHYSERDRQGKPFMRDSGVLNGIEIDHRLYPEKSDYFVNTNFSFLSGTTDYVGGIYNLETKQSRHFETKEENAIFDGKLTLGTQSYVSENQIVEGKIGYGYWLLANFKNENEPSSYGRRIHYQYLPVNIGHHLMIGSKLRIHTSFTYNYFLQGKVLSNINEVLEKNQTEGHGYLGSIGISYITESFTVIIRPFYQRWEIARSNSDQTEIDGEIFTFEEPENTTEMVGVNVGVSF